MTTPPGKCFPSPAPCFPRVGAGDKSGFTLLELTVVLAIISLVTAMAVTSGIAVLATARQTATVQKMAGIDKALMAFRIANDRIPCPADLTLPPGSANYGVEAATPSVSTNASSVSGGGVWSTCINGPAGTPQANFYLQYGDGSIPAVSSVEGGVPTVALGLANDFMVDGWGNRIRYAVDASMTVTGSFSAMPAGALCGPINVCDAAGAGTNTTGGPCGGNCSGCVNPRSSAAIYALISHGANGYGAYTQSGAMSSSQSDNPNEQTNCHAYGGTCATAGAPATFVPVYVQQSPSQDPNDPLDAFDDIVSFRERWQMQTPWDKQGVVCPQTWLSVPTAAPTNFVYRNAPNAGGAMSIVFPAENPAPGSATSQVNAPTASALDGNGNVWVLDSGNSRLVKFTNDSQQWLTNIVGGGYTGGQWLMTIGGGAPTSSPADSPNNCSGYATSPTTAAPLPGTVGYCGQEQGSCNCSSGTGNGLFSFTGTGAMGIAIDPGGNIWVADNGNNRVQEFSSNGQWLMTAGGGASCTQCISASSCTCISGTGNGEFNDPVGIAVDPGGNIWVADNGNNRVQKFNSNGQWLLTVGGGTLCTGCVSTSSCTCSAGSANGQFSSPSGIAIDASGNLWVADYNNNRVQEFNSTGTFMVSIGGTGGPPGTCTIPPGAACPSGSASGQFSAPIAVAVDAGGSLWVEDSNQLQKFGNIGGTWTFLQQTNDKGAAGLAVAR